MKPVARILVVDDDEDITRLLADYLQHYGFEVVCAANARRMREILSSVSVQLVVLDWMLPDSDGLSLTRELRQTTQMPIIMLTARSAPDDRVIGLENGADDYMCKPFEPRELVARIGSVLRSRRRDWARSALALERSDQIRFDGWVLHRQARQICAPDGGIVPLSHAEYRLLDAFISRPHHLLNREQLLEAAHGRAVDQLDRSVDLLISRLRHKLSAHGQREDVIRTVRGSGYMFTAQRIEPASSWTVQ